MLIKFEYKFYSFLQAYELHNQIRLYVRQRYIYTLIKEKIVNSVTKLLTHIDLGGLTLE